METSKKLLSYAMLALTEGDVPDNKWSIGGGTILAFNYNHRISKDIDVFIDDIQYLSNLSPRFNDNSDSALSYNEMSNYISLLFPEGKVDFIAGSQITKFKAKRQLFCDKSIFLDDPVEIISKKIYYRGEQVLTRDIFDLAVVYSNRKEDLINAALTMSEQMVKFINCFKKEYCKANIIPYSQKYADMLLPGGISYKGKESNICNDFIECFHQISKLKDIQIKKLPNLSLLNDSEAFNLAAATVLKKQNWIWVKDTTQSIVNVLYQNKCPVKKIQRCMSYSPLPVDNFTKLSKNLSKGLTL